MESICIIHEQEMFQRNLFFMKQETLVVITDLSRNEMPHNKLKDKCKNLKTFETQFTGNYSVFRKSLLEVVPRRIMSAAIQSKFTSNYSERLIF